MSEITYLVEEMKDKPEEDTPFGEEAGNTDSDYYGLSGRGNRFGGSKGASKFYEGTNETGEQGNNPATLDELKDILGK